MTRPSPLVAAAAFATVLTLSACSNATHQPGPASSAAAPANASNSPSSGPTHDDADVTFAQQMIPHHQQAIQMSDIILAKPGIDPRVTQLANQITAAQGPEIQMMQTWLRQWGRPLAPTPATPATAMPAMPGHGAMSGMMSDADMAALHNADGPAASKLFLTQMIEHHRGAIDAAQAEISAGRNAPAVTLARSIVASQQQEIATMQSLGASL
ncbi:DUF305 domain-containing protein [Mycobacterium sp.]|uniref:DUF305 domain-containing protein n=1 Tax=Mycobacterium sp. TaxID=1785 RepID=UPI0025F255BA|nr:DUF305 domain-containing protein [Mycobacterium sp.]